MQKLLLAAFWLNEMVLYVVSRSEYCICKFSLKEEVNDDGVRIIRIGKERHTTTQVAFL